MHFYRYCDVHRLILMASIRLYWLTDTFPRCIYPYRSFDQYGYIDKPSGFSFFPKELYVDQYRSSQASCVVRKSH